MRPLRSQSLYSLYHPSHRIAALTLAYCETEAF